MTVTFTAPSQPGGYLSFWDMQNAQGVNLFTPLRNPLWVALNVISGPAPTPTPPNDGGYSSSGVLGDIEVLSVEYPSVVTPGQSFRPRVTIKVNQGQLLQSRGDLLRNFDDHLFEAWPHVAVVGTVNAGETYTFEFYENNPMIAPSGEGTYESRWRVWRDGNWAGPEITIRFDVRGGGGTRPNPPTLVSPGNWYVSRDGSTPTLCASAPAGLQYYFQIYESHDIPESGWINNNCWTPPGLGWYGYQWHVRVKDPSTGLVSDWSETWHFEISSQDVVTHGPFFSPGSPSAADEVRTWFCVEDQGGVEIYANTATDGSANGEWQWIAPVIGVCNLDENYPDRWPEWHTRMQPDGTHLIRGKAWRGNYGQPGYKERIVETTYTLLRRRPSNVQLINPGQDAWFNTRTITFRWNPEESQRVNTFAFHVSTNPDPVVNPIVTQTFNASTREYTYTFDQDYPSLYWGVQACNELGCGDRAIGHFGIDRATPSSAINVLNPTTFETVFQVSWTGGTDNASAIRWYDVQYRDGDRGTWTDWQTNVPSTVAIFTGQPGHKYYFRARALDNAGNLEDYPAGDGDTFTLVNPAAAPPTPWWNNAYAYKRNILISNNVGNTMVAGYPVRLHFDSGTVPTAAELYAASQSSTKGDDFRIIYNNSTELARWVQNFSSSRIDIWFKTQANIGGNASNGTSHQLYYGNPSASNPPANIDDVMPPGKDVNTMGLWHFADGAGSTFVDSSGRGHHGSLVGAFGWGDDSFGPYIEWYGGNATAWGEVASSSDFNLNTLTMEAWIYPTTWGNEEAIFYRPLALPDNCPGYKLAVSDRKIDLQLNCAGGRNNAGDLSANTWTHIAATYDGSNMRIYRNGNLVRTVAYSESVRSTSGRPLYLGGAPFAEVFAGRVRHARLSNIARSDFSYAANLAAITIAPSLAVGDPILPPVTGSPNLAVLDLTTYPNSVGGTLVQAVVQNQGNRDTQNGFYIDLYADHLPTGPGDYTGSIRYWVASPIEAGSTVTLTTLVTDTGQVALAAVAAQTAPLSEVTSTLYVQADSAGVISETNKADNISQGLEVCFATADLYESDNDAGSSQPIAAGETQTHNVGGPGDEDWLRIEARAGLIYTLQTSNLASSADTYLYLYAADGTTLLATNDDHGGSLASYLEWLPDADGTYYALVKHWNPNVGGCGTSYDVSLARRLPGDIDGDCEVTMVDVASVAGRWRAREGEPEFSSLHDFNRDGRIDLFDVQKTATLWGRTCDNPPPPPTRTPTPTATHTPTSTATPTPTVSDYRLMVLADGPLAYWRLGEPSGATTAIDSSSHGYNGTPSGGVTFGAAGALEGDSDTAVTLDGSTGAIRLPDFYFGPSTSFSIEAWARTDGPGGIVFSQQRCTPGTVVLGIGSEGIGDFWVRGENDLPVDVAGPATFGTWHHLVGVRDATADKIRLYIDGMLVSEADDITTGSITAPMTETWIGKRYPCAATNHFPGTVDEVAVYDKALTSDRILAHYHAGRPSALTPIPTPMATYTPTPTNTPTPTPTTTTTPTTTSPGPVVHWRMEEGSGMTVADSSGHGHLLTLAASPNSPAWSSETPPTSFANTGSLVFDGVDDYADAGDVSDFDFITGFTVAAWVKASSTQNSVDSAIVSKLGQCCSYQGWMIWCRDPLNAYINGAPRADATTNIRDGRWHHVAMTWDGATVKIYVDGQLEGSGAYAFPPNSAGQPLRVGEYRDYAFGSRNFTGNIDEVMLYNYARSAEQIRADAGLGP